MILPDDAADARPLRVRWGGRSEPSFAECAEALGCTTADIMAVQMRGADCIALYTPAPNDPMIWGALLQRDDAGILRVKAEQPRPGLAQEIQAALEDADAE